MSDDIKNLIKNIVILIVVVICSLFLATQFSNIYERFFPQRVGGGLLTIPDSGVDYFLGLPLAYIFFLALLFTAFGGGKKYWWIGVLLIPAIIFEVYFDLAHIYFPIALGLIGWLLGFLVLKFFPKSITT